MLIGKTIALLVKVSMAWDFKNSVKSQKKQYFIKKLLTLRVDAKKTSDSLKANFLLIGHH